MWREMLLAVGVAGAGAAGCAPEAPKACSVDSDNSTISYAPGCLPESLSNPQKALLEGILSSYREKGMTTSGLSIQKSTEKFLFTALAEGKQVIVAGNLAGGQAVELETQPLRDFLRAKEISLSNMVWGSEQEFAAMSVATEKEGTTHLGLIFFEGQSYAYAIIQAEPGDRLSPLDSFTVVEKGAKNEVLLYETRMANGDIAINIVALNRFKFGNIDPTTRTGL